ncbi:MAG: hypothetical protein JWN61_2493 [Pseudonocardiales bacterium]|nr:hypothetical protein [Jatrophihabitantaceae bacterium]MCW2604358.1 hypothetical protein [Pseudonocardiales bacterium]
MASRFLRALADPWTGLTAATIGGVAWAATLGFPLAAGAAAIAYGVKVAYDLAFPRSGDPVPPPGQEKLPEPPAGSLEAQLVERARRAVVTLAEISSTTTDQWSREQIDGVRGEAGQVVPDLLRAAQRLTTASAARARISVPELERYQADLARRRAGTPEDLQRSRASVQAQLDIAARLDETCETLASRLESAVLDLETLTAQAAEVSASTVTSLDTSRPVEDLIAQLASVREGLRAADDYSRKALE